MGLAVPEQPGIRGPSKARLLEGCGVLRALVGMMVRKIRVAEISRI